ncbi:Gp15 family bacteriophage protein [Virgibacillus natechei]|nr:Gp15 family bacteriophage protein [Virgibacillus natechei]UZD13089.1 bacteriophage Gp15 family protein [Virgibacillus natechei]
MLLTEFIEDKFKYGRCVLHVDMAYDNILRLFDLFRDDSFNQYDQIDIGLEMLLHDYDKIEDLALDKKYELFKFILLEFIDIDLDKPQEQSGEKQEKIYDFDIDADRIYASFLMDYKIDLMDLQGELHWKKFFALFEGLSSETPFQKVVGYRTAKAPKETKHNKEQRNNIKKLKQKYALEQKEQNADDVFNDMITAFGGTQS